MTKEVTKKIQKIVRTDVDGLIGPNTLRAICKNFSLEYFSDSRKSVLAIQKHVGVTEDGIYGIKTATAILEKLQSQQNPLFKFYIEKPVSITKMQYKTDLLPQSVIRKGNSKFGKAGNESALVSVKVPDNYPLKYAGKKVSTIRIHNLVADRLEAILKDVIAHYGDDIEDVAPGICVYDGSYNFRNTRGGSSQSIHSWGLAIDWDAANNQLSWGKDRARLAEAVYEPFWKIAEAHGMASLGKHDNRDWMHGQFTLWG